MTNTGPRAFDLKLGNPLRDSIFITSRIRFEASRRLKLLSVYSTTSLTLLSCYLVVLNIFQIVFRKFITDIGGDILNVFNIGISIIMIVVGLIEYSTTKDVRSKELESSARDLSKLYALISTVAGLDQLTPERYQSFATEYEMTLQKCPVTHADGDFKIYRARSPKLFPGYTTPWLLRQISIIYMRLTVYGFYFFVALVLPIVSCFAMYYFKRSLFTGQ